MDRGTRRDRRRPRAHGRRARSDRAVVPRSGARSRWSSTAPRCRVSRNEEILAKVGATGHARASAIDTKQQSILLHDCSAPLEPIVRWIDYENGVYDTHNG